MRTDLEKTIKEANKAYREGNPFMDDKTYDKYLEQLEDCDPDNPLLKKSVIEEIVSLDRMEKLPLPMFSLEKKKTLEEITSWINSLDCKGNFVITPKYDGISLLVSENNNKAWTRGDGVEGQKCISHFRCMENELLSTSKYDYTWGEAIINKRAFEIVRDIDFEGKKYKVARNAVAGMFNSPKPNSIGLNFVDYVRYGSDMKEDKSIQLTILSNERSNISTFIVRQKSYFLKETLLDNLNELYKMWSEEYCIDGLVIEVDDFEKREELGRLPNGNPRYAIAFKNPEWSERKKTIIKDVEINVSKDGKLKPVLIIDPIEIGGATVSRVTGINARYLYENHLAKDSKIIVTRSGEVIPKHLETLSYDKDQCAKLLSSMMYCPECGKRTCWDESRIELVCQNQECSGRQLKNLVCFFTTVEFEDFGEPTIKKLYEAGYHTHQDILRLSEEEILKLDGFGKSSAKKIVKQCSDLLSNGISLARYLAAINIFDGQIGEKTCQKILNGVPEGCEDFTLWKGNKYFILDRLLDEEGIGKITATTFIDAIIENIDAIIEKPFPITYTKEKNIEAAQNQFSVCFTGIRDKDLEKELTEKGHKVVSGVSAKTTHLVVKERGSGSTKENKAITLKIPILTLEEFKAQYKDQL